MQKDCLKKKKKGELEDKYGASNVDEKNFGSLKKSLLKIRRTDKKIQPTDGPRKKVDVSMEK
jgi:hypothetical protein